MTGLRALAAAGAMLALAAAGCGGSGDDKGGDGTGTASGGSGSPLVGLFRLEAGACTPAGASGSWFRMVQPGGTVENGPFVTNGDSPCADKTWTVLTPGADGGLRTGSYQPQPDPPFDRDGNAVAAAVARPQKWFAVTFSLATNQVDPQTGARVPQPRIVASGKSLSGDLSALAAAWNGQHFNQGAPKPGGQRPGNTTGPRGSYDPSARTFSLDWSSQVVGGPFNNFTGVWHLEGRFEPA